MLQRHRFHDTTSLAEFIDRPTAIYRKVCDALDIEKGIAPTNKGEFLADLTSLTESFEDWCRCESARLEIAFESLPVLASREISNLKLIDSVSSGLRYRRTWIGVAVFVSATVVAAVFITSQRHIEPIGSEVELAK